MKTKEKILLTSLQLFNEQGERQVTTNHIAAELGISPGNLYYHFKNKTDIIFEIFKLYEGQVVENLNVPNDRALTLEDKLHYLQKIFDGLWEYRFLHRDLEHYLSDDPRLKQRYRQFFHLCMRQAIAIYSGLREAGIIELDDEDLQALSLNTWLVVTSWVGFANSSLDQTESLSQDLIRRGMYQVFTLERPFVSEEYQDLVKSAVAEYGPSMMPLSI